MQPSTENDGEMTSEQRASLMRFPPASMPQNAILSSNTALKPSLLEGFQIRSTALSFGRRSPPESASGISGDVDSRLRLDSTSFDDEIDEDDDDDDSLEDTESANTDEYDSPFYGLPVVTLPTGLCYDDRMRYHAEVASTSENDLHPEDPRRIYYIFKELSEAGLVADPKKSRSLVAQPLVRIDAREATREECCLIHTDAHYEFVKGTAGIFAFPYSCLAQKKYPKPESRSNR